MKASDMAGGSLVTASLLLRSSRPTPRSKMATRAGFASTVRDLRWL